jgi:anti-sigma B factor antagonist
MQETTDLTVRPVNARTAVIDIAGDLTVAEEAALMDAYARASGARGVRAVVLNFGALEYMNSTGIGLLVTLLVRANRQGMRLFACGLSDHYRQILELTRLDEAISVFDTEAEAVAAADRID